MWSLFSDIPIEIFPYQPEVDNLKPEVGELFGFIEFHSSHFRFLTMWSLFVDVSD